MNFLKENKFFIILIYINIIFIVALTKICYKIENFNYLFITMLYLIGILFYWCFSSVKSKLMKTIIILLLVGSVVVYCFLNFNYVKAVFLKQIIDNFNFINGLVAKAMPTDFANFKPIFIMILPIITIITISLSSKGFPNSVLVLNLALIVTLWYLGYTEEIKITLFYYVLITLSTYCINSFIINTKKLSKKGIKIEIQSYKIFIYTIIVSLMIAGVSNILPQNYSGKYSSELQSKFYNKFVNSSETQQEMGKKYKYDLSFSGYDNNKKKLGGPIVLNKLTAFKVNSEKPYYLRGTVKEVYDGFSWSQDEKKYKVKKSKEEVVSQDKFYKSYSELNQVIKIIPQELNTSTIFTPSLPYNAEITKGYIYYDDIPTLISNEVLVSPYSVYFYSLNYEGQQLLKNNTDKVNEVSGVYYSENYKKYLQLPDNISSRTYDLVYNLVKGKKNNFEKVNAIRDYLNKNYPYTLKVSQVPEGQEFLDYFLFTEKKGYCTYFATAETIMCRIAGIPARYVEGFNMSNEKDGDGLYVVRNENAHAWSEVLYMDSAEKGMWYTVDAVPNAVEVIHNEEEADKIKTGNTPGIDLGSNKNDPSKRPSSNANQIGENKANGITIPPVILKIIYILIIIIAINISAVLYFNIKRKLMLNNKSSIPIYKYSLSRLETIGYRNSEFAPDSNIINTMDESLAEKVKAVSVLAYREYYGQKEPKEFDKKAYYSFIENRIKINQSKLEYYIKKYYYFKKMSLLKNKVVVLYKKIKQY
ncbi:transglutaminase-like protein [Clostridiales bacterium oral taxon 876 str. F0540]|nr:transglutaminase-like protein [Clostridiales bacterium oral taxon 876 str. F0540]